MAKPKTPAVPSKPQTPAEAHRDAGKKEITSVYFTDDKGVRIKEADYNSTIRVYITSKNLIGSNFKLTVLDKDNLTNDVLIDAKEYTFTGNTIYIPIPLTASMQRKGGDFFYQNLFVDIVVLATSKHLVSVPINVDLKEIKHDPITNVTKFVVEKSEVGKTESCGEKYCIKKGDKSELIREINIRLAGFGGNVPTDEFTDRTEKMIKQFQRDYMKVEETGKVCGNVLRAIDEFCIIWTEKIAEYTCLCKGVKSVVNKCSGFGKGRYENEFTSSSKIERYHKYERPGMHRSLLWGTSALKFYLSQQKVYKYMWKTAGYRCWEHNNSVPRKSTNHMGKAVDIQFSKNGITIQGKKQGNIPLLNEINDKFYSKYLNAKYQWVNGKNNFSIEPIGTTKDHTYSWIHLDVREFENDFLEDKYFVKTQDKIIDGSISELAKKLGFLKTCMCNSKGNNSDKTPKEEDAKNDRINPKTLKTSVKGIQFIKDWESFKARLYDDDSEDHHCTIGYGHLVHRGRCNGSESEEFKKGITKERATELFNLRLPEFEKAVQRDVTVPLYQYEFDALVSLLFNCGENFFVKKKAPKLHSNLLAKDYEAAATEFLDVTSKGLSGLVKRRKAENNMFLNNIYDSTH